MNTAPPLTHHEILTLVEPFSRSGRQVDLAASDRAARKLRFKPQLRAGAADDGSDLTETLLLDCQGASRFMLERLLVHPGGAEACLQALGPEPGALLACIDAVTAARHFQTGPGYLVARSYEFLSLPADPTALAPDAMPLYMGRAVAQLDGLQLEMSLRMPGFRSVPADLRLEPTHGASIDLPQDLLAVQGWDWARIEAKQGGWNSKLRLRGKALRRSRLAEPALQQAARHLAAVLAEAPERFHDRHRLARWGVVLRRSIPTLTGLGMIAGALLLAKFSDGSNAGPWMALHYLPIAVMALSFKVQEMAQFELPPLPRRSRVGRWPSATPAPQRSSLSNLPSRASVSR
jgi:hypothetical protein